MKLTDLNLTIAVQFVSFLLFYILMKRFVFGPLTHVLSARESELARLRETTQALKKQAESFRTQYEEGIRDAQKRASETMEQKQQEAARQAREALEDSRREARKLWEKARQEIEGEKEAVLARLRGEVDDLAVEVKRAVFR